MMRAWLAALALAAGAAAPAHAGEPPVTLRVMTFNVWYGGEQLSLAKVAEAIRAADPDVVGLQEADRNLERIAEAAGMPYVDTRRRLLSRWPIFDSGSGIRTAAGPAPYSLTALDPDALHAWVMVLPGKVVAVANVHLSNGVELAGRRTEEARPLAALAALAAGGTPVFLTGDFNSASHLDAMRAGDAPDEDAPDAGAHAVTRLLAEAGLRDSFREAHPDAAARPGLTWTPGAPHPLHERNRSRIDYVFTAGPVKTLDSRVVGEAGGPFTDIPVSPWPSDHRAVVSMFEVVPRDAPALIAATPRRVEAGEAVMLRTWDPRGPAWTALIAPRGGSPREARTGVRDLPQDWQRAIPLSTVGLEPGDDDALLVDEDGSVLRRCAFSVATPGARPALEAPDPRVTAGSPIRARWRNAPGALRDWVGLYRAGETDASQYLAFAYTEAAFDGELSLLPEPGTAPPAPGRYELRLLHDESYVVLAVAPVEVVR
jgi:endonuclease/exonuclease/phosphatase family metal-dependent hydrolase